MASQMRENTNVSATVMKARCGVQQPWCSATSGSKVRVVRFATLLILVSAVSALWSAQQSRDPNGTRLTAEGPPAICEAAASKLREAGTNQVVLVMPISAR